MKKYVVSLSLLVVYIAGTSANTDLTDYGSLCPERYSFVVTVFRGSPDGRTIKSVSISFQLAV